MSVEDLSPEQILMLRDIREAIWRALNLRSDHIVLFERIIESAGIDPALIREDVPE